MFPVVLGIESIFLDFFGNIFNDIFVVVFLLTGMLCGIFFRPWFGNQVIKLIDREYRFVDLDIDEETAVSIECKDKKGMPPQRFYKWRPAYTGIMGKFVKKPVTRFFGKEGTAYTWGMGAEEEGKATDPKDPKTFKPMGKLCDAIKTLWGNAFYDEIPEKQKELLEKSQIQFTVQLDQGPLTPSGYKVVSEEDIKAEEDRKAAETFWQGKKTIEKGQWIQWIFILLAGFGIACALMIIGILRIPSGNTTTTTPPPGNGTATTSAVGFFFWILQRLI